MRQHSDHGALRTLTSHHSITKRAGATDPISGFGTNTALGSSRGDPKVGLARRMVVTTYVALASIIGPHAAAWTVE